MLWGHQTPALDTASPCLSKVSWLQLRGQLGFSGAMPGSPLMSGFSGLQVRSLEAHMYPEKLKVIAQQVQLQQQQEQVRLLHQEKLEREQQIRTQVSAPQTPPGTGTRGVGSVMDLAPPVATDVPAKLSLSDLGKGWPKAPHGAWGCACRHPVFQGGAVDWTTRGGFPVALFPAQRGLYGGGHLLPERVSSPGLQLSLGDSH